MKKNYTSKMLCTGAVALFLLSSCSKQDETPLSENGEIITELTAAEIAALEAEADAEDALDVLTGKRGDFNLSY